MLFKPRQSLLLPFAFDVKGSSLDGGIGCYSILMQRFEKNPFQDADLGLEFVFFRFAMWTIKVNPDFGVHVLHDLYQPPPERLSALFVNAYHFFEVALGEGVPHIILWIVKKVCPRCRIYYFLHFAVVSFAVEY